MDDQLLRCFLAIYDTRSVSRAAEILGVRQSTASAALGRLRQATSDHLFVNTARGMEPTPRAHELVLLAREALTSIDLMRADVQSEFDAALVSREFRVVAGDILEGIVLTRALGGMRAAAPRARIASLAVEPHDLEERMARFDIDVCLGHYPAFGPNVLETTITQFTYNCFAHADHRLAGRKASVEEFSNAKYILLDSANTITDIAENWLQTHKIARNVVVRTAHFHCIPMLLAASDLIAVVPTDLDGSWFFGSDVSKIELPFELPRPELKMYWHRVVQDDPEHRWFRRMLAEEMKRPVTHTYPDLLPRLQA